MITKNKIKVVWLCHFSNEQTRDRLPLRKRRVLYDLVKRITKQPRRTAKYQDFAPWVSNLIIEFEKFEDIELHVISPQTGLRGLTSEFEINGIFYHFYNPDYTLFLSTLIKNVNIWRKVQPSSFLVKKFIRKVKPNIINLIGAENYYHSCVVLDIKHIPIYVSCQTIYTNPLRFKFNPNAKSSKNWKIELLIHQKEKYFGCQGRMHRDLLLKNNSEAEVFKMFFPIQRPNKVVEVEKEYDFVCFAAGHGSNKGTDDAIEALAIVKKQYPGISLNIVGKISDDFKLEISTRIKEMGLESNIFFNNYFPIHADMHQHLKKSKFALLPVKMDVIPGTVFEAILLGLPLITYKTTGTPYINKNTDCILIADLGDIGALAKLMIKLLQNPEYGKKLADNAKHFVDVEFDNTTSALRLKENYISVIDNYHRDTPIPDDQLFSVDEFPVY